MRRPGAAADVELAGAGRRPAAAEGPRASRRSKAPKHVQQRAERAEERRVKTLARNPGRLPLAGPVAIKDLTAPEEFSVSGAQAQSYLAEVEEFEAWHKATPTVRKIDIRDVDNLDAVAVNYIAHLWEQGDEVQVVRAVVFGLIFKRGLPKVRTTLPRCRRAIAGYEKERPIESRDPTPIEALALLVDDLVHQDTQSDGGDILALLAAAAATNQFDAGGRPTETIELTREKIIPPQGRRFARMAIMFHPQNMGKASKSGKTDDTVMCGLDPEYRSLFVGTLEALYQATRPGERLFSPLTLPAYERIVAGASQRCGLDELKTVPHNFRHGMAAHALHHKLLDEKALQTRMRVLTPATVKRYGKTGKLQRQMQLLGRSKRLQGEALLKGTTPEKNPFLSMISRLKHLRRRRKELGL